MARSFQNNFTREKFDTTELYEQLASEVFCNSIVKFPLFYHESCQIRLDFDLELASAIIYSRHVLMTSFKLKTGRTD